MTESTRRVSTTVPEGWVALLDSDPSASPSHRPELWEAMAAAVPAFEWRVLELRDGGLAGGAPLVISRRGPFRWVHALPWLLPAPPLARAGQHARADDALCAAFADLAAEERAVGGEWSFYRPEGPAPDASALSRVPGETRRFSTAVLPLAAGLDAVRSELHRKQRQALDHALAQPFTFAEDPVGLEEAQALHLAQSRHWPGHRPVPLELCSRLLRAGPAEARVGRLFTLRSRHELVSATFALDGPHETFVWWSGTRPEGRRVNAFVRLLWGVAEWAAARGRRRLNLGASGGLSQVAAFKSALGATLVDYPVRWLDSRNASLAGRGLALAQAFRRRGRARGEAM